MRDANSGDGSSPMSGHPEFERLVYWREGQLPAPEAAEVAAHVSGCAFCSRRAERLAALAHSLRAGPGRPSDPARAAVFRAFRRVYPPRRSSVARLAYDSRPLSPKPGQRAGADDSPQMLYSCAEADIALSLRVQDEALWSLTGQLMPAAAMVRQPADILLVADARLVTQAGVNFWTTLPLAGLFCAAVAVLIGLPILRLRGVYFAMVTLVLTEVGRLTALALPVTNGAKGITSIPLPGELSVFGITIIPDFATLESPKLAFYLMATTLMVVTYLVLWRIVNSRLGHLCRSLQQNEELASSIGVNTAMLRVLAYAISSFFGGIAGAIFVAISQSIYPSSFVVTDSVNFMLYCFLGGLGHVFGPMLGTLLLYFGWDLLSVAKEYQLLIYSGAMIALMLVLPNGVLSLLDRKGGGK